MTIPTAQIWVMRQAAVPVSDTLPTALRSDDLVSADDSTIQVPRVIVANLPSTLPEVEDVETRKTLFIRTVLPLILEVNRYIRMDRERLLELKTRIDSGQALTEPERRWLAAIGREYRVPNLDFDLLLRRVDTIPPSLALAQAAIESAWGTSRFAQAGNALFGQWTWSREGITPRLRPEGERYRVRRFETLLGSVYAYMRNLNAGLFYREFRTVRAEMKNNGRPRDSAILAGMLLNYSERGTEYVEELRQIMRANNFYRYDTATLMESSERQEAAANLTMLAKTDASSH